MNYKLFTYAIYFIVLLFVVLYVGTHLFRNGRPFLVKTFAGNEPAADSVNKFLLIGYYLVNIGYTVLALKIWREIPDTKGMLEALGYKVGYILVTLGIMHLFNVLTLILIAKRKHTL